MNRELPWIAPLVQQCLSFFLDGGKSKPIEVEDDGTNLNFRVKLDAKAKLASVCFSLCEFWVYLLTE